MRINSLEKMSQNGCHVTFCIKYIKNPTQQIFKYFDLLSLPIYLHNYNMEPIVTKNLKPKGKILGLSGPSEWVRASRV